MHNFLKSCRGSVAFGTLIASIPLVCTLGLGVEAGSWYVTKQHAQNAADAMAYAGALNLACRIAAVQGATCTDSSAAIASKNGFANGASVGGATQTVPVVRVGTWTAPTWKDSVTGTFVLATVESSQPPILAWLLGMKTAINITAQAIAQVKQPKPACALGLQGMTLIGGAVISGSNCAFQSDTSVKTGNNVTFTGANMAVEAVSGCQSPCGVPSGLATYNWYSQPATNPLSSLDSSTMFASVNTSASNKAAPLACQSNSCTLVPSTTTAYGALNINGGQTLQLTTGGTYIFYDAAITVNGGAALMGTNVNIVLLCPASGCKSNSKITINGGTVKLSANWSNATFPGLDGVLIYDQSGGAANVAGSVGSYFEGALYFPKADVTFGGNTQSTTLNATNACTEVISNTLSVQGNAYLSSTNCGTNLAPQTQIVVLVR